MNLENDKKSLRQTAILLDFSENLNDTDYRPTRLVCVIDFLNVGL